MKKKRDSAALRPELALSVLQQLIRIRTNLTDGCEMDAVKYAASILPDSIKLTVIDKKVYPELQRQYCADPQAGACPCYHVEDTFIFERSEKRDDFWHMGLNTLVSTTADPDTVAGGPKMPHCSEAWDAIARYLYTGLQGGSIMRGWMREENTMIVCCSDGTRPVIFRIERIDE